MTGVNTLFALRRLPHIGNALRSLPRDSEPRLYLEEQLEACHQASLTALDEVLSALSNPADIRLRRGGNRRRKQSHPA